MTCVSWTYWSSAVHRARARAALGLPAPQRALLQLPQHDPAREPDRAGRLRARAHRAAADVPELRLRGRAADFGGITTGACSSQLAANPYAAMPSLHAADALIVGCVMALDRASGGSRRCSGSLWPPWVWFVVMGTGNHFWLDIVSRRRGRRSSLRRSSTVSALRARLAAHDGVAAQWHAGTRRSSKRRYIDGVRRAAANSVDRARADACVAQRAHGHGRIALLRWPRWLVYFEYRDEILLLLARRGALHRRVDPRHPRRRARPAEQQGDAVRRVPRLDDRPASASRSCSRDRDRVHARRQRDRVAGHVRRGRRVAARQLHARPRGGARAEGRRRARQPRRARGRHLGRPDPAPWWVWLPLAIYLLNFTAWVTVGQRAWSVRKQLRERES